MLCAESGTTSRARFMGHGHRTLWKEHSPSSSPAKRRRGRRHHQRSRKKQKIISSETETPHSSYDSICSTHPSLFTNRRKWTYSPHHLSNYTDRIVVLSYNILGTENAVKHPQLYREVSSEHLDWEYRKKLIYKEVKGYQASIMCFQEVDKFDDLNDLLGKDGFRGLHKARSGENRDGCAIFWKAELFTLLHEENIDFQKFGLRHNVAQFCVLKMNQDLPGSGATAGTLCATTSRSLLVGNIHVLYNPKRGDIKLGQMRIFLQRAYDLSQEWGGIPVILTGDLNSLPQSAMYQFLASSKLNLQQHDRRKICGQIFGSGFAESHRSNHISRPLVYRWTEEEIMFATGSRLSSLRHQLNLSSAYAEVPGSSKVRDEIGEPLATSYHSLFSGTVDYIWHTLDLVPVKVLETLPMRSLQKTGGLPSKKWGSDHLALVCELAFADDGESHA